MFNHDGRHRAWWILNKLGYSKLVVVIGYDYSKAPDASLPAPEDVYCEQGKFPEDHFRYPKQLAYGLLGQKMSRDTPVYLKGAAMYRVSRTKFDAEFNL